MKKELKYSCKIKSKIYRTLDFIFKRLKTSSVLEKVLDLSSSRQDKRES